MRKFALVVCFCILALRAGATRYVFYLHGRIVEEMGPNAVETNQGFGAYEYYKILDAFKKEEFTVISECRPKGTDVQAYARKVLRQVDSLLKKGIKPEEITIIGASKGAVIAQYASTFIRNPKVNYVFMGGCGDGIEESNPGINYCGNVLSIYEASDNIGNSCDKMHKKSTASIPHYKEIKLNTGLRHGFLYRPLPEWVKPAVKWGRGQYN